MRTLLILGGLSALGPASMDGYIPALPALSDDLGASASLGQVTLAVFMFGLGAGQLAFGPLSDAYGRRGPLLTAIGMFVCASLACAAATSIELLIASRFVQGATAAAGIAISRAVVRDLYSGSDVARFLSRLVLIYGLAPFLAPLVGGLVLAWIDWRGVFVCIAGIGIGMLAVAWLGLPETLPRERRLDRTELGLAGLGLLMRDRSFVGYACALGSANGAVLAYLAAAPFVLQGIYGISPQAFGLLVGIGGAAMIGASQLNVYLLRYTRPSRLLRGGGTLMVCLGFSLLAVIELDLGLLIVPCMVGLMACWGFIPSNAISLAMEEHPEIAGTASATLGLFQYGLAGLAAPLVGIAGRDTALPMALVVLGLALCSRLSVMLLTRRREPGSRDCAP